jgi:hypothetical protein
MAANLRGRADGSVTSHANLSRGRGHGCHLFFPAQIRIPQVDILLALFLDGPSGKVKASCLVG